MSCFHDYEWESPPEAPVPVCPVCGNECEEVTLNLNGEVLWCDVCRDDFVWVRDAVEWMEDMKS